MALQKWTYPPFSSPEFWRQCQDNFSEIFETWCQLPLEEIPICWENSSKSQMFGLIRQAAWQTNGFTEKNDFSHLGKDLDYWDPWLFEPKEIKTPHKIISSRGYQFIHRFFNEDWQPKNGFYLEESSFNSFAQLLIEVYFYYPEKYSQMFVLRKIPKDLWPAILSKLNNVVKDFSNYHNIDYLPSKVAQDLRDYGKSFPRNN